MFRLARGYTIRIRVLVGLAALVMTTASVVMLAGSTATASVPPTASPPSISGVSLLGGPALSTFARLAETSSAVSFSGDVVPLAKSAQVFRGSTGAAGAWKTVSVPSPVVPSSAAGSLLVAVRAQGAGNPGQVLVRPAGAAGAGTGVLDYPKTALASGTSLVRLGEGGLQVKSTVTKPTVTVQVLGWVPKTSALVVPSAPVAAGAPVSVSSTATRSLTVAGVGGVPADARSVVLRVRTAAASAAGSMAVWSEGATPTQGTGFPAKSHTWTTTVAPTNGKVNLRTLSGSATTQVQVLGWSAGPTSLTGAKLPVARQDVTPGAVRTVQVAGVGAVPATDVDTAMVSFSAPTGARVDVWDNRVGTEVADASVVSRGGVITLPVPLSGAGDFDVAVTGTNTTMVMVTGWSANPTGEAVSFVPKANTRFVSPAEVTATAGRTITIDKTAQAPPDGGHVLVRPRNGDAPYLGKVLARQTLSTGQDKLTLGRAALHEAFDDYDATYTGHGNDDITAAAIERSLRTTSGAGNGGGTTPAASSATTGTHTAARGLPLGLNAWDCNTEVDTEDIISTDLDVAITPNLSVDLSARIFDFSAKGTITATITLASEVQVNCTLDPGRPMLSIPVGATGLAMKIGISGTADFEAEGSLTFTNTTRVYASVSYYDGETDQTTAAGNSSDVTPNGQLKGKINFGAKVSIGPLQPPGTEDLVTAAVSVTLGTEFVLGPPVHPYVGAGVFKGKACYDLTATPYLEVGAQIVTPFFKDIDLSLPRVDLASLTLYKGPCIGYTGTIEFKQTRDYYKACPGGSCDSPVRFHSVENFVMTLPGEPMVWYGMDVLQPFAWHATIEQKTSTHCSSSLSAEGQGFEQFSDERWPYLALVDWETDQEPYLSGIFHGEDSVGTTTSSCSDSDHSTQPWTGTVWPEGFKIPSAPVQYPGGLSKHPALSLTGTHVVHADSDDDGTEPDEVVEYKINLVRHQYQR